MAFARDSTCSKFQKKKHPPISYHQRFVEDFEITPEDEEFITTKPGPVTDLKISALSPSCSSATQTATSGDQEILEIRKFSVTAYQGTDYYGARTRFRWTQTFLPEQNSGLLLVYLVEACSALRDKGEEGEEASEKFEDQILAFGQVVKAFEESNVQFLTLIWDGDEFEQKFDLQQFSRKYEDFQEKMSEKIATGDKTPAEIACDFLGEKFRSEVSESIHLSHISGSLSDSTLFSKVLTVVQQMETTKH